MSNVITIAQTLAEEFRTRAAEYDRTGEFPTTNYARMREAGYLYAPAPAELGGCGASLLEMCRAQQALARGCGSTALAVNMHLFQVGAIADAWRNGQPVEAFLRRIVNEGIDRRLQWRRVDRAGEWTTSTSRKAHIFRIRDQRAQVLLLTGAGLRRRAVYRT